MKLISYQGYFKIIKNVKCFLFAIKSLVRIIVVVSEFPNLLFYKKSRKK